MKQQAKITNWKIVQYFGGNYVLVGKVLDHPRQDSFRDDVQMTSNLLSIDLVNKKAETLNTTYELLEQEK